MTLAILTLALLVAPALSQHSHGVDSGGDTPTKIVITDIERVSMVYNENLCLDLLLFPCSTHDTTGESPLCGSDGKTYSDHCTFAHARCMFHNLRFVATGHCSNVPVTAPASTVAGVTAKPTVEASWTFIKDVFCRNIVSISCKGSPADPVCGTDGNTYPNHCLLAKVKCYVADLEVAKDPSSCKASST